MYLPNQTADVGFGQLLILIVAIQGFQKLAKILYWLTEYPMSYFVVRFQMDHMFVISVTIQAALIRNIFSLELLKKIQMIKY